MSAPGPVVGYAQLSTVDPAAWRATGSTWASLAGVAERRAGELTDSGTALRTGWSGSAAGSAGARLTGLREELAALVPAAIETDQVLAEFAARLVAARARLTAAVTLAATTGVLIDRRGGVRADPARVPSAGAALVGRGSPRPSVAGWWCTSRS
ncbi:hypothetical protein [Verrucosispora sioxanthis]|uniref:hypothetical protein n=1 Tax=Verrucosispora sioxanthis TaxID=2499994 RepID=UPI00209D0159|nr:hypothetical protein [Verrucosispora sioxanthis]